MTSNYLNNFGTNEAICCNFHHIFTEQLVELKIVDAEKKSEGSNYICYVINFLDYEVRRRYSEFETFRTALTKLYPTLLIPPIPNKHSIAQYAVKPTRAKEDIGMIDKRKRLLERFLNRLASHPILVKDHLFHRFLERDTNWPEVLSSPPVSLILKNPSQTTNPNATVDNNEVAVGPVIAKVKNPDPHFDRAEQFTQQVQLVLSGPLTKSQKGLTKKLGEYSKDLSELGAIYNGFSLGEHGELASAIEKAGQATDISFMASQDLCNSLDPILLEPLEDYIKYSESAIKALKYRTSKQIQLEKANDHLLHKQTQLDSLEFAELESKRLEAALQKETDLRDPYSDDDSLYPEDELNNTGHLPRQRSRASSHLQQPQLQSQLPRKDENGFEEQNLLNDNNNHNQQINNSNNLEVPNQPNTSINNNNNNNTSTTTAATTTTTTTSTNLLTFLSYTFHGLIDVDPETSRRNAITKTKELILNSKENVSNLNKELLLTSQQVQDDLNRFQNQKVVDFNQILKQLAECHLNWCKSNLEAWQDALDEAKLIPSNRTIIINQLPKSPNPSIKSDLSD